MSREWANPHMRAKELEHAAQPRILVVHVHREFPVDAEKFRECLEGAFDIGRVLQDPETEDLVE